MNTYKLRKEAASKVELFFALDDLFILWIKELKSIGYFLIPFYSNWSTDFMYIYTYLFIHASFTNILFEFDF